MKLRCRLVTVELNHEDKNLSFANRSKTDEGVVRKTIDETEVLLPEAVKQNYQFTKPLNMRFDIFGQRHFFVEV